TIIASQSIITGAFSMTRQAIALGWMPRLRVIQTSEEGYGQIYVGAVNWLLMIATLGLTIIFRRSDNLAAAYGIAVSLTMLLTSVLLFIAMREIWGWSRVKAGAAALVFLVVDFGFFTANVTKVLEGGYVPLLLAVAVYGIMWIWHRGTSAVRARVLADQVPLKKFVETLGSRDVARVPGTALFLTRADSETPPVFGLARSEKPFPAPGRPHTQAHRHIVSAHKTERTDSGCARCRQILARRSALWIYGAAKRLSHTRRLQDQGCGNQSRR